MNIGDDVRPRGLLIEAGCVVVACEPIEYEIGIKKNGDAGRVPAQPGKYVCTIEAPDGLRFAGIVLTSRDIIPKRVVLLRR